MSILAMRLAIGILFLLLGIATFTRNWLFPEFAATRDSLRMNLAGVFALVFGGLNLARWYAAWAFRKSSQTPVRYPLQRDPSAEPQVEPIPEFDFTRTSDTEKLEGNKGTESEQ
jgi:hypothetical protein